jgi:hypothetical protein
VEAIPRRLILADKRAQNQVSNLTSEFVTDNLPDLSMLDQQQAGGVMRELAAATILTYGGVATQAARTSYDTMMLAANPVTSYEAQALNVPERVDDLVDRSVGRGMATFQQGLFVEAATYLAATISRHVTNLYRETHSVNSDRDPNAVGYQRVASPDSCAFCAFAAATAGVTTDTDVEFHDNCRCSAVPVPKGTNLEFRPDYYEKFDDDAGFAAAEIRKRSEPVRDKFFADARARGVRVKSMDYFRAYPENAVNTSNILAEMRKAGYR